ncbi:MAG: anti-sigma factor family protein [Terriglobales bacterium]
MTISCQQFAEWSSEYLDGELEGAVSADARAHVESCACCHALLTSLGTTVRLLGAEATFAPSEGVQERLRQALAAGLDEPLAPPLHPAAASPPARAALAKAGAWSWLVGLGRGSGPAWIAVVVIIIVAVGLLRVRAGAITTSGWLIDSHCLAAYRNKMAVHPSACLLKCAQKAAAIGVVDARGDFLVFDASGRKRVIAEVRASHKPDDLWVTVRGHRAGSAGSPMLDVEQIELTPPGTTRFLTR